MATMVKVQPMHLNCGDQIVIQNNVHTVKYIDGPDRIGTYDVNVIDEIHKYLSSNSDQSVRINDDDKNNENGSESLIIKETSNK